MKSTLLLEECLDDKQEPVSTIYDYLVILGNVLLFLLSTFIIIYICVADTSLYNHHVIITGPYLAIFSGYSLFVLLWPEKHTGDTCFLYIYGPSFSLSQRMYLLDVGFT